MKITAVESFILRVPTQKPIALEFPEQKLVAAHVRTDDGVTGLGYSLCMGGGGAEAIQVYLETRLKSLLLGQDPLFVERLWERMYRADRGIKRQGVAGYAISVLDIALWDVAGKAASLPCFKLWGAVTDRVPAYGSGGWPGYSVDDVIAEALRYESLGCRYYKMKIHDPDPRVNRQRVESVRKALGDGVRMMVDVNQKLDVLGYLMPDVCRANGFSETLKIARLAAAHSVLVSPHVVHELSLQILGALPNGFLAEWIDWAPADLLEGMPACEDGHFRIPDRPGHGLALTADAMKKYRAA